MVKKYKWFLVVASIITILPVFFGVMLWDELPDMIATHWGFDNQPNGYTSRAMTVYGIPSVMLAALWFCAVATEMDMKKKNHDPKMLRLMFASIPLMSILLMTITYANALGIKINVGFWAMIFVGVLFAAIGNYMPKCRQNWTMGVRNRWTLSDSENWNRTHRFAGYIWTIGGLLTVIAAFFSKIPVVAYSIFGVFLVMAFLPNLYSYLYYKKHKSEEE